MDGDRVVGSFTILVDSKPQTATYLLSAGVAWRGLLQEAEREDVWVIPALSEGGVAEDEAKGVVAVEQLLLISQNCVVRLSVLGNTLILI